MKIRLEQGQKLDSEEFILKGFADLEISTQIIIRDALNRGLTVEVLDRASHFLRISGNGLARLVKEASKTDLDSYMTFLVMENKTITKMVLAEKGIRVPIGTSISKKKDGIDYYKLNSTKRMVVKPVTTNFGIGITILAPQSSESIVEKAMETALSFAETEIGRAHV